MIPTLEAFLNQNNWKPKFKPGSVDRKWFHFRFGTVEEEKAIEITYQLLEEKSAAGL